MRGDARRVHRTALLRLSFFRHCFCCIQHSLTSLYTCLLACLVSVAALRALVSSCRLLLCSFLFSDARLSGASQHLVRSLSVIEFTPVRLLFCHVVSSRLMFRALKYLRAPRQKATIFLLLLVERRARAHCAYITLPVARPQAPVRVKAAQGQATAEPIARRMLGHRHRLSAGNSVSMCCLTRVL
jgi:hypothetical protein